MSVNVFFFVNLRIFFSRKGHNWERRYLGIKKIGGKFMKIRLKKINNNLVVYPTGEIDHHTAEELRLVIDSKFENLCAKNIIVDFNEVSFMDSSGIGMIIGRYKHANNHGGKVVVSGVSDAMRKIFTLSGLGRIISIYTTVDEAINNI